MLGSKNCTINEGIRKKRPNFLDKRVTSFRYSTINENGTISESGQNSPTNHFRKGPKVSQQKWYHFRKGPQFLKKIGIISEKGKIPPPPKMISFQKRAKILQQIWYPFQ